jgi:CheY-like chemotaxis protein/HPt (histidine-containing phosphotransfer) domain-containing protein
MEPADYDPRLYGRILIAEDGRDTQHLLRVILERTGLKVDSAENGVRACEMVEAGQATGTAPDLILMDIQMPELDGFESLRRLRYWGWKGPVVALTAHALPEDRQRCLAAGFDDYLPKPVDRVRLLEVVTRHLGSRVNPPAPPVGQASSRPSGLLDDPRINPDDRARILAGFIVRLQDRANQIERAMAGLDRSVILESAHALHGSAGLFGFEAIAEVSRTVEGQIRSEVSWDALMTSAAELVRLCRETAAHFHA